LFLLVAGFWWLVALTAMTDFGHIGILMGGPSSERDISLKSGQAVYEALKSAGYHVSPIDIPSSKEEEVVALIQAAHINVAFIALHGQFGEDGTIQAILEKMGIPYTGSGVAASRLAVNKIATQTIFQKNNIPIPSHVIVHQEDKPEEDTIIDQLGGLPVVVKPEAEGSSIGITLVQNKNDLKAALREAFRYGPRALVEQYIRGRELTVGILDDKPLSVIEIRPKEKLFDFTAKYQKGLTEYLIPAPLKNGIKENVQRTALQVHRILGCRHFSRVDIMLDEKMKPFVLEVNTIPGFTSMSLLPKAAKQDGYDFAQLCLTLIKLAYEKAK